MSKKTKYWRRLYKDAEWGRKKWMEAAYSRMAERDRAYAEVDALKKKQLMEKYDGDYFFGLANELNEVVVKYKKAEMALSNIGIKINKDGAVDIPSHMLEDKENGG